VSSELSKKEALLKWMMSDAIENDPDMAGE